MDVDARAELALLAKGQLAAQIAGTAARLGVMDAIADGARAAADVARILGTHPQATLRLLRALAALGLLAEAEPGRFTVTAKGALLRPGTPGTLHSLFRLVTNPALVRGWERLDDGVRTGATTFDQVYGADIFTYLKARPQLSAEYNAAMGEAAQDVVADVAAHYDFGRFRTVVDVGGGDGTFLSAILRAHPGPRGIVHDSAEGLARTADRLEREGLGGRCVPQPGDFFAAVPAGGDLYLLKSILHDWDDERCALVLRRIREAVPDDGRLLIVEPVLPATVPAEAGAEQFAYLSDINMLLTYGGRERTRADFEELCAAADFTVTSVMPLPPPVPYALIEAAPAPGR